PAVRQAARRAPRPPCETACQRQAPRWDSSRQGELAWARPEAEGDEPLLPCGADDRLAVEALEGQALDAAARDELGQGLEGRLDAGVVGVDEHLQALAAPLDEQDGLGSREDDVGARLAGRAARGVGPLQSGTVGLCRVGGGEDDRGCGVVVALSAQAL